MGWGDAEIELAGKIRADADKLRAAGRISDATYKEVTGRAASLLATGQARKSESKTDRFKKGITSVGKVVVGTVAGVLTGGPVGAVAGFVGTAASLQSGGVAPASLVDVSTPPIVSPKQQQPKPVGLVDDNGSPGPLLILAGWAVMLWIVFKKVLK